MLEETLEEKQPRQVIKKQRHYFAYKDPCSQSYGFSSSHVQTWELDNKKGWLLKNWCFWTVVLEKTLESPLDSKEIKPVNSKGNQPWIFTGSADAEAEAPVLWPPDEENELIGRDPDAGKDWRQEEMKEDEMVGLHHQLDGHEFEQALGVGDGQGSLACSSLWGCKESDLTERLNNILYLLLVSFQLLEIKQLQSRWTFPLFTPSDFPRLEALSASFSRWLTCV